MSRSLKLDFENVIIFISNEIDLTQLANLFRAPAKVSSNEFLCLIPRDSIELGIRWLHHKLSFFGRKDFPQDLRCSPMKTIYLVMADHDNVPKSGVYVQMSAVSCQFLSLSSTLFSHPSAVSMAKKDYIVYRTEKQTRTHALSIYHSSFIDFNQIPCNSNYQRTRVQIGNYRHTQFPVNSMSSILRIKVSRRLTGASPFKRFPISFHGQNHVNQVCEYLTNQCGCLARKTRKIVILV